jgi:hypothetical protein
MVNDKYRFDGVVIDNYIKCSDMVGVWDYYNTIVFMDGVILSRVC